MFTSTYWPPLDNGHLTPSHAKWPLWRRSTVILKQSDFEGYAKKILGYEHILPKIRDMGKSLVLIVDQ